MIGKVVDYDTGKPLAGIVVAEARDSQRFEGMLAGDHLAGNASGVASAVTSADGSFSLPMPGSGRFLFAAFGEPHSYVTFHGTFAGRSAALGSIRLIYPTRDERAALDEINRFRGAPGGDGRLGVASHLVFDENLTESARFWAAQEVRAGRIGHSCAALGDPAGCVEFNAFFHALPGAPQDWFAGQNAAFDTVASWSDPNSGFEDEGRLCAPAYDWRTCGSAERGETGHFVNLMTANRWAGFGSKELPGSGVYYAMNII